MNGLPINVGLYRGFVHVAGAKSKGKAGQAEELGKPLPATIEVEGAARWVRAGPYGDYYRSA